MKSMKSNFNDIIEGKLFLSYTNHEEIENILDGKDYFNKVLKILDIEEYNNIFIPADRYFGDYFKDIYINPIGEDEENYKNDVKLKLNYITDNEYLNLFISKFLILQESTFKMDVNSMICRQYILSRFSENYISDYFSYEIKNLKKYITNSIGNKGDLRYEINYKLFINNDSLYLYLKINNLNKSNKNLPAEKKEVNKMDIKEKENNKEVMESNKIKSNNRNIKLVFDKIRERINRVTYNENNECLHYSLLSLDIQSTEYNITDILSRDNFQFIDSKNQPIESPNYVYIVIDNFVMEFNFIELPIDLKFIKTSEKDIPSEYFPFKVNLRLLETNTSTNKSRQITEVIKIAKYFKPSYVSITLNDIMKSKVKNKDLLKYAVKCRKNRIILYVTSETDYKYIKESCDYYDIDDMDDEYDYQYIDDIKFAIHALIDNNSNKLLSNLSIKVNKVINKEGDEELLKDSLEEDFVELLLDGKVLYNYDKEKEIANYIENKLKNNPLVIEITGTFDGVKDSIRLYEEYIIE